MDKYPKLTKEQECLKLMIYACRVKSARLEALFNDLQEQCNHVIVPRVLALQNVSTGAVCLICAKEFGWYCPKSPKKYCEYDKEHGEACIHCGQPEERK